MKNFLKENWFKLVIALMVVVAGLSIAYYYVLFLPQKEQARLEQQRQEQLAEELKEQQAKLEKRKTECQKLCEKRAIEDKEYWSGGITFEAYCKYDAISDVCYFSGGGKVSKDNYWERYIKNAETNQKLKVAWNADFVDKNNEGHSDYITEYWNEHKAIFGF